MDEDVDAALDLDADTDIPEDEEETGPNGDYLVGTLR